MGFLTLAFETRRSIEIYRPAAEVFALVADFTSWRSWSPWLCMEPDCPVRIEGEPGSPGHAQHWEGDTSIRLARVEPERALLYDLEFLKPWKSRSQAGFDFEPTGAGGCRVIWWMRGSLPLFLFFMRRTMAAWVGSDYARGLGMLKELAETGRVPSRIEVPGVVDRAGLHFLGVRRQCGLDEIGPAMSADFARLHGLLEESRLPPPDHEFSIYYRYDMIGGRCDYLSGFAYATPPTVAAGPAEPGLESGQLPAHRALRVDHIGPYRHLGNAWSTAVGCQRNRHKLNKSVPMYEIYANRPGEVAEDELRTEVYLPVKG